MSAGAGQSGAAGGARTEAGAGGEPSRFRRTLVRVLLVQVATLILLWLLQSAYHG